jgi:GH15 family glucan-1,4-alpha-glucosidase
MAFEPDAPRSIPIEGYALIGDTETAALVARDGSIDWMCVPRFDSGACFAALLGNRSHGRWLIAPRGESVVKRQYRDGCPILETTFTTSEGTVRLVDCMPLRQDTPKVVRVVEGVEGCVPVELDLVIRYDYGSIVPWVRALPDGRLSAVAGADALVLQSERKTHGQGLSTVTEFDVHAGERIPFVLSWYPSHRSPPPRLDPCRALADTESWWREWLGRYKVECCWSSAVVSSLVALKTLTYAPTGGIVAAATTSLPEMMGGVRNWDYRYCWLRDATSTLYSLMLAGYKDEAGAWRDWLLRSVAGDPAKLQIMYGLGGERRLTEHELPWLSGFGGSKPVRAGNAAATQLQLDVYGEVMDALYQAHRAGLPPDAAAWRVQRALLDFLESHWQKPDQGMWEFRGREQSLTHSKIMAWVAFDRAVKSVERFKMDGPVERWRKIRDSIHREVCASAWNSEKNAFTQSYGSPLLDSALLLMPQVGFLSATDPRVVATVNAIERELMRDGLLLRYSTECQDGLPPGEGAFLACSFWLADCYALQGRVQEAKQLFERLLAIRNDVGLLAEEYDVDNHRMLGNFPQAFSHVGLLNTAFNLTAGFAKPAQDRGNA